MIQWIGTVLFHIEVQWWWKRWTYFYWFFSGSERWMAGVWRQILFFLLRFSTSSLKILQSIHCIMLFRMYRPFVLRGTAHFWTHVIVSNLLWRERCNNSGVYNHNYAFMFDIINIHAWFTECAVFLLCLSFMQQRGSGALVISALLDFFTFALCPPYRYVRKVQYVNEEVK